MAIVTELSARNIVFRLSNFGVKAKVYRDYGKPTVKEITEKTWANVHFASKEPLQHKAFRVLSDGINNIAGNSIPSHTLHK